VYAERGRGRKSEERRGGEGDGDRKIDREGELGVPSGEMKRQGETK